MELQKRESHLSKTGQINSVAFTKKLAVFIQNDDVVNLVKCERGLDLSISSNATIIKDVAKEVGEDQLVTVLAGLILRASSFFNITNNLTENQAIEIAFILVEKFYSETVEDFVLMFKNAKLGKYGKLYNRLDGQIIMEWMDFYLEEKAEYRERIHERIKAESYTKANEITNLLELKKVEEEKPVIDALKEAIQFDQMRPESDFSEYRKNYILEKLKKDNGK